MLKLPTLDGFNLDSSMSEQEQSGKNVIGSKGRSSEIQKLTLARQFQTMGIMLPKTMFNLHAVGIPEIQGENFCNFNFYAMPNPRKEKMIGCQSL